MTINQLEGLLTLLYAGGDDDDGQGNEPFGGWDLKNFLQELS